MRGTVPYQHENGAIDLADFPARNFRWKGFEYLIVANPDGSITDYRNVGMDSIPLEVLFADPVTRRIAGGILGGEDVLSTEFMDQLEKIE